MRPGFPLAPWSRQEPRPRPQARARAGGAGATGPGGREEGDPLARPRAVPGSARRAAPARRPRGGRGGGGGAAAARDTGGLRHRPRRGFESPRLPAASP